MTDATYHAYVFYKTDILTSSYDFIVSPETREEMTRQWQTDISVIRCADIDGVRYHLTTNGLQVLKFVPEFPVKKPPRPERDHDAWMFSIVHYCRRKTMFPETQDYDFTDFAEELAEWERVHVMGLKPKSDAPQPKFVVPPPGKDEGGNNV